MLRKKYLFIPKKFGKLKRGAWMASLDLKETFDEFIDIRESRSIRRISDVVNDYEKLIFITQVPHLYHLNISFIALRNINHLIYLRGEYVSPLYNSCNNGFHYYREHNQIKHYIPFIPNLPKYENKNYRVGFYYRPWLNPDSCKWFIDNYVDNDIPIMTMGSVPIRLLQRKNWKHTFDRNEFFSNITDYIYVKSKKFNDPFPTSLCEAVQTGKNIKIIDIGYRPFKDGINDIEDCINYDDSLLNFSNWIKWYGNILNNGFNNVMDRNKYNNFSNWILNEVI
jgi:hypothetical protein